MAENNETHFKLLGGDVLDFVIDFRDWKYLTNFKRFSKRIYNQDVIAGNIEDSIEVNLNKVIS